MTSNARDNAYSMVFSPLGVAASTAEMEKGI